MAGHAILPQIGDADLKLLQIFRTVAECGGLAASETELNIGRSTISKHLSDLEHRLGLRLCDRGPAGFSLTDDGAKVLQAAETLLGAVSNFRSQVNEVKKQLVGTVHLAMFDQFLTNPEANLAHAIAEFNAIAPEVEIEWSLMAPTQIELQVMEGAVDIGITTMHRTNSALHYLPIYGEDMFLYCSDTHPFFDRAPDGLTLNDLKQSNFVGLKFNSPNLQFSKKLGVRTTAKVQNEQTLALLVLSGSYIGFLPDHLAASFVEKGRMRRILPDHLYYRSRFAAVSRRSPQVNRISRLFLDILHRHHMKNPQ